MESTKLGAATLLTEFFRHNLWANLSLLDYCEGLSDAQLEATSNGVYGSIRATLQHYLSSEVDYVNLLTGKWPEVVPDEKEFAGFAPLRDGAHWAADQLVAWAQTARPSDIVHVERPGEPVTEYPYTDFMVQIINHSTEHRTQISAIITQLGLTPPSMTGWAYMRASGVFHEYEKPA